MTTNNTCHRSLYMDGIIHILSGFLYAFLALNTKLTNLALLPFLLVWSAVQSIKKMKKPTSTSVILYRLIIILTSFLLGAVVGYAPWMFTYYYSTGRFLPNAWPSKAMIKNSIYLQEAINKPFYFYIAVLTKISPVHVFGCVILLKSLLDYIWNAIERLNKKEKVKGISKIDDENLSSDSEYWILLLWPMGYLLGHTLVGVQGGGYQTRFLLPALPAMSIIAAISLVKFPKLSPILYTFFAIECMHVMFYGIMFYPMFADFEFSVFDIVTTILNSPQYALKSREMYIQAFKYMRHFGLDRKIAIDGQ